MSRYVTGCVHINLSSLKGSRGLGVRDPQVLLALPLEVFEVDLLCAPYTFEMFLHTG